jgi:heptosyltransferase II
MIEPTSILAFRNGSIGNTLAAVPALRALKQKYSSAPLTVVVDPVGYELLEVCPWIDRLIIYDKRNRDQGFLPWLRLVRELRSVRPSHAVLFKRFYRNGVLAYLSGARVRAGFETDGKAPFLNLTVPYDESVSIVELNLRLAALLKAESAKRNLELWLSDNDIRLALEATAGHVPVGHSYTVAHYGGLTTPPDFLPLPHFAEMLKSVHPSGEPVFLIGTGDTERRWAEELHRLFPSAIPIFGLDVRVSAALIQGARLFVGFNSGPAHLAAAVHTPSLIIFRPDARVQQEIHKWLPPSETSQPLIPPAADDTTWSGFLERARTMASELRTAALSSRSSVSS